jgi:hypothetical protein
MLARPWSAAITIEETSAEARRVESAREVQRHDVRRLDHAPDLVLGLEEMRGHAMGYPNVRLVAEHPR